MLIEIYRQQRSYDLKALTINTDHIVKVYPLEGNSSGVEFSSGESKAFLIPYQELCSLLKVEKSIE